MRRSIHHLFFILSVIILLSCKKEEYIDALGNVDEEIADTSNYQSAFVGYYSVSHHCESYKYTFPSEFYETISISKTPIKGILKFTFLQDGSGYGYDNKTVEIVPNLQGEFGYSTWTSNNHKGSIDVSTGHIEYSYYLDSYQCSCSGYKY